MIGRGVTTRRIGRLGSGLGLSLGTLALLAAGTMSAQAAEGEFMRDAMSGIGLIEPERPAITYNERAPLVMPPNLSGKAARPAQRKGPKAAAAGGGLDAGVPQGLPLPLPRTRAADPQWPKDPEITQREREAVEAKKPVVRGAQGRMNDNNETLSVYEMEAGRREGAGKLDGVASTPGDGDTRASTWLDPLALFKGRKEDEGPSIVEPSRDVLSDPPTGYRKAPVKVQHSQGGPVGTFNDNQEADPRAYLRQQGTR